MTVVTKACLACSRLIKGRTDKKFCDDTCRNNYNNRLNSDASPFVRTVNNTLRRNRRIMQEIVMEHEKKKEKQQERNGHNKWETTDHKERSVYISKEALTAKGFRFQLFTHTYTNSSSETYYYCYDYGYKEVNEKGYRVMKALPEILEKLV